MLFVITSATKPHLVGKVTTHTHTLTHTLQEMKPITFTWSMKSATKTAQSPFYTEWPFTDTIHTQSMHTHTRTHTHPNKEAVLSNMGVADQQRWGTRLR